MAPRETENNAYAKFWGDKQRALWSLSKRVRFVLSHLKASVNETGCEEV